MLDKISVIIATRGRSDQLSETSLPSLLRQDCTDFDIIVWDASEDDLSLEVVRKMNPRFRERGIVLVHFRAPRTGSASQRNDAVEMAGGSLIFFVDDDSEVSPDGIRALKECFEKNPDAKGAALVVDELVDGSYQGSPGSSSGRFKDRIFDWLGFRKTRKVSPGGSAKGLYSPPGPAEWLSGCSMAFRREVFSNLSFNEDLETFGPYALGEDIEFSHRVFLHYGQPLFLAEKGKVIHWPAPEPRFQETERFIASRIYNRYLTMKASSVRSPAIGRLGYCWFLIKNFVAMPYRYGLRTALHGFAMVLGRFSEIRSKEEPARQKEKKLKNHH